MVDYIDVRNKSIKSKMREELIKKDQESTKNKIPFCFRCANIDFNNKIESTIKEALLKEGDVKEDDLKLPKLDLKQYEGKNNFEEHRITEAWDKMKGTSKEELIGYHIDYKCKKRGCGRTIFLNLEEYKKLKGDK